MLGVQGITVGKIIMVTAVRWPEPNAGWCVGMCVEAYLALDLFRSFCIQAKKRKEKKCEHLRERWIKHV